jgi:DNA invertase Pin-like site-specific DNA recombinase
MARREFDLVAAWSVDRLGRSSQDLISFLGELRAKGVDLYLHQQGIDTGTPAGKALFQMMGVFAEFERAMIVERVRSCIASAAGGKGMLKVAAEFGVGSGTVQRIKASMAAR